MYLLCYEYVLDYGVQPMEVEGAWRNFATTHTFIGVAGAFFSFFFFFFFLSLFFFYFFLTVTFFFFLLSSLLAAIS